MTAVHQVSNPVIFSLIPVRKALAMSTRVNKTPPVKRVSSKRHAGFPIVGIGASAGGLETLQLFFSKMSPETNTAFVIIQHLSPNFKSIMASLLAKYTRMTVCEIEDGMTLAQNCVYLNPPNKNVAIFNRTLHLMAPVKSSAINMPIDRGVTSPTVIEIDGRPLS